MNSSARRQRSKLFFSARSAIECPEIDDPAASADAGSAPSRGRDRFARLEDNRPGIKSIFEANQPLVSIALDKSPHLAVYKQ